MNNNEQTWTKPPFSGEMELTTVAVLRKRIESAAAGVKRPPGTESLPQMRRKELPKTTYEEVGQVEPEQVGRKSKEYETIEVTGSKGKKYKVTVPASYVPNVPKNWEWDTRKMAAAELIAQGIPISQVIQDPDVDIKSRLTIYAWLEHPEFKEHVDALVTETGYANQRERIAGMNRLTSKLFDKLVDELEGVRITDKSIGAIISGIHAGMKHLAQEKGEFVEQQNVQQQTQISGTLATAHIDVKDVLKNASEDERKALEAEFDKVGDEIIRQFSGEK